MILLIDNFDSFTYNIFQYLRKLNYEVTVKRNNAVTIRQIESMRPSHIIISPGPGRPENAGISPEVVRYFGGKLPILGICLGHQSIGHVLGASITAAPELFHGKASLIYHDEKGLFSGIKNPFTAIRYHSLVIDKTTLPEELEVSAWTEDGDIMGVRHKRQFMAGLQFHPESIGTEFGYELLVNFLEGQVEPLFTRSAIKKVCVGESLSESEAEKVMAEITSGSVSHAAIASLLTAMSLKGETVDEMTGFARIMRSKSLPVKGPEGRDLVDTCGTGGDHSGTFNISTTASFVVAGAGVPVAKHGNRSVTSKCGSADVMEALGVNIATDTATMEKALDVVGLAFLFAPKLHHSMKHAGQVRREMGIRTIFNILGPLANPAGAAYQVIGVFSEEIMERMARTLINLGVERALVVHGCDGLDEITLTGKTRVIEVNKGWLKRYTIDPTDYGFGYCDPEDIKGGDLKTNSNMVCSVLRGEKGPRRDITVLNAAAALYISGKSETMRQAVALAQKSIDSGAALDKLEHLVTLSHAG
ncbi:MAG: bifunctional anthranilate synthase component II/anthranilate phosphoribosyltransferase [bacterium]|nr:bifunctional anthranilate synthase component II/anthranilate phosphoribosyltransferase [bacterium]